jgi:hypothetical protein
MYILDTDHLSIADKDSIEAFNLGRRLAAISPDSVAICFFYRLISLANV